MKNKLYIHEGAGHYIGSTVIVCAENFEEAKKLIKQELIDWGLPNEELNVEEIQIKKNTTIYVCNGDY